METTKKEDKIPPFKPGQWNSFRPEDVKRWGVERFLAEAAPKEPIPMLDFDFTEEENQRMDEILRAEREAKDRGL